MSDPLLPAHLQWFATAVLVAMLAWVVQLIRTQRLGLRDSLLWLLSTGAALAVTVFPSVLRWIASRLSILVPANALFALAFVYVLVNLLAATIAISGHSARIRRLTQECTLLRAELAALRDRLDTRGERSR